MFPFGQILTIRYSAPKSGRHDIFGFGNKEKKWSRERCSWSLSLKYSFSDFVEFLHEAFDEYERDPDPVFKYPKKARKYVLDRMHFLEWWTRRLRHRFESEPVALAELNDKTRTFLESFVEWHACASAGVNPETYAVSTLEAEAWILALIPKEEKKRLSKRSKIFSHIPVRVERYDLDLPGVKYHKR